MSQAFTEASFQPTQTLQWLFFDLNSYFASVEQQDRPELRGKPIVIVPSWTDATCAIAASYEAKTYGIKTGTKIYDAKKLCPNLLCVLARHDIYVNYHTRIMAEIENHIPITKICSIDEAACKLWDNESSKEKAILLAHAIKTGLKDNIGEFIRCSIGIAPNIFLAKTATDMQKPDGLVVLEPHNYTNRLFEMELRDLCGIGHNMIKRLNHAGIHTIEQFYNIPPKHARKIWGSVAGERFWYKLHGYEIPDIPTQKSVVGHSRVLDPIHRESNAAHSIARQLTSKASTRLRRYNLYASKFILSVRTINKTYWRHETSFLATQDSAFILEALAKLWHSMQHDTHSVRLKKISVTLSGLQEKENMTLDLLAPCERQDKNLHSQPSKDHMQIGTIMDKINKRYGAQTLNLGVCPKTNDGYVGTKIAFTRIPEQTEFNE